MDGHHSGTQNWFDRLNPETGDWQVLPDTTNKRDHAPTAIVGNKLYFFGGRETGGHNGSDYNALFFATIADVDVYDFATGTWSTHPAPLPIQTAEGVTGVLNEKIHYVGGEAGRMEAFVDLQIFDPKSSIWSEDPPLNRARHGTNCCVYDNKLWIAAGSGARWGRTRIDQYREFNVRLSRE